MTVRESSENGITGFCDNFLIVPSHYAYLLSSVYRPYDCITAPFYIAGGTKKAAECTEMKHARAK